MPKPNDIPSPSTPAGLTPDEIDRVPQLPGVYIMRDAKERVIYVGKAVNLHSRVKSYFTKSGDTRHNVRFLLRHVERVETVVTANESEAFLLENTLIKKHQPRYNIRLRDDKTYVSVRINMNHQWPRAVVMRRRETGASDGRGVIYLGPYASAGDTRETLRQLQRIFPIRSCADHVLKNRARPCLLQQIGRCCAPCTEAVDPGEYHALVEGTVMFLKGKTGEIVKGLQAKMAGYAGEMEYERAAAVRDRIRAIEATIERQRVHQHGGADRDVCVLRLKGGYGSFVVFVYRNGLLTSSRPYLVKDHGQGEAALMNEFLTRYYELETPPRELLADPAPEDAQALEGWLEGRREGAVDLVTPQRGEKRQLVASAAENAEKLLEQHLSGARTIEEIQAEIADKLHLDETPDPIECYDISTFQGASTVGSMVTFRGGEPDKNRYRKFKIKSFAGQDDFGAIREVLTRRLRRIAEGAEEPPGLIVIDGGRGQLAAALAAREEAGLDSIPMAGMAKSRVKRRGETTERTEERFFLPGRSNPVKFAPNSPALYLLVRLRDEAHRFGITFHRDLRGKAALRSELESIPGLGPKRIKLLLTRFGSIKSLREADLEALKQTPGIPDELAGRVFEFLRQDEIAPESEAAN